MTTQDELRRQWEAQQKAAGWDVPDVPDENKIVTHHAVMPKARDVDDGVWLTGSQVQTIVEFFMLFKALLPVIEPAVKSFGRQRQLKKLEREQKACEDMIFSEYDARAEEIARLAAMGHRFPGRN